MYAEVVTCSIHTAHLVLKPPNKAVVIVQSFTQQQNYNKLGPNLFQNEVQALQEHANGSDLS